MQHRDLILKMLRDLLEVIGASYTDIVTEDLAGQTIFSIKTADGRPLIGPHGDTIHAIDFLLKKMVEKALAPTTTQPDSPAEEPRFLVDVNDYRSKQIKDIQTKALMMAERARSFQYDVELSPMSSYERLIVHTTLQGAPHIKTESQGEGRNRRVVIRYSADTEAIS